MVIDVLIAIPVIKQRNSLIDSAEALRRIVVAEPGPQIFVGGFAFQNNRSIRA
ncbi:MAG: hypothetical protein PHD57_10340 [Desulfobacterales bacterium]|nr:hypothetical protein [Desulfobacterales bacterium]MDD3082664.1 hypothetical protein [Desulfobacterales bacterium]MDD3951589.1 hypothetical protein [Desulfobacterales bacterium]